MSQSDFVTRGQALVAAGQFQEAVKVCRLGLLGRPNTVDGRVVLGQALLALKRYDEVLAEARVALELDPSSHSAQVLRAEALLRKGDTQAAIEELHRARQASPGNARISQLLAEAEQGGNRRGVSHPSVGFVGDTDGAGYTRPTSLQAPGSARRSSRRAAVVGPDGADKTGTVEVDPELEGVELGGDPDFDDVAPPPPAKALFGKDQVIATQQLDVDDDDLEELEEIEETPAPVLFGKRGGKAAPGPGTKVRNAVAMPSGVIGDMADKSRPMAIPSPYGSSPTAAPGEKTRPQSILEGPALSATVPPTQLPPLPAAMAPTALAPVPRPAAMAPTAVAPAVMPPAPLPPPPGSAPYGAPTSLPLGGPPPRAPIAAALPTMAAAQPPPPFVQQQAPYPPTPASYTAAARPTLAVPQPVAVPPPMSMPMHEARAGAWPAQDVPSVAPANEPTVRPAELDASILSLIAEQPVAQPHIAMQHVALQGQPDAMALRTGMRRTRSKLQIALWMLVGMGVIGGGVFAGFKIRALRLDKQIAAARKHATDLAKADTWNGWTSARASLSGIVQASPTPANRASLARTRALIAFEFGDGVTEAKTAVEQLDGQGGRDGRIAESFSALVRGDARAARTASDAAVAGSDADPAAQYVAGESALFAGDVKVAVAAMKLAADKEPRPLYGIGLARAYAAASNWDEAIAAIDKVRAASPDNPGAIIERAQISTVSGRITAPVANDIAKQLDGVIAESQLPVDKQTRGVSPTQAAFAGLALARVELARGDVAAARRAVRAAVDANIDDVRFAEETVDVLYTMGELALARSAGDLAMAHYPKSARARIATALVLLAQGRPNDAVDLLSKQADTMVYPDALAARGNAYLALGDTVSAAADFDAALKKAPMHEPSLVGRTWLELATGDVESATKRMAERMSPKGASLAVTTAYAATLRHAGDAASRAQAQELLEKVVAGPAGPEQVRAQLELARIYRDDGDFAKARAAFDKAARNGGFEPRFEGALLSIDYSKPAQGRELLERLLEEAGDRPSAALIIETARARLLVGEHAAAAELLAQADKMSSVERYKLDRERGRLSLRKSDFDGAVAALGRALDGCGTDGETFLLAADAAIAAPKSGMMEKVKSLAAQRLQGHPEAHIVDGKLLIAAGKLDDAEAAYRKATEELAKENASYRRRAQADFGLAVVAYQRGNMAATQTALDVVLEEDPSIVDAYIFAAEIAKDKKKAYAFAKKATQYNPDYAYAWLVVGRLAHELKDKRTLVDAIGRLTVLAPSGDELAELQKLNKKR